MPEGEHDETEGTAAIAYACDDCGRVHNRNNPPCNRCGSMNLSVTEAADDPTRLIDEGQSWDLVRDANRQITGVGVFVYAVGVGTVGYGAVLLYLGSRIVAPALLAAGLLTTPVVRRRVERYAAVRLSPLAVLGLYLTLTVGGLVLAVLL